MRSCYLLVLATFLVALGSDASGETLVLSTENLDGVYSSLLVTGQLYEFTVSGMYDYGNAPNTYADAEWSDLDDWSEVVDGYTREADILDVVIDNTPVDWHGSTDGVNFSPHTFSPSHVYKQWHIGTGSTVHFHVADLFPWGGDATGDNEGSLVVQIAPIPEPSSILVLLCGVALPLLRRRRA